MRAPLILGVLARGLLLSTVLTQSAWAITPGQRSVLFGNPYKPVWQWNFASTSALPSGGSIVVNTPSPGGLVTDASGNLTYAPNNLLTYSNAIGNSAWVKGGATGTSNTVVAPDGTTTASSIVESAASEYHSIYQLGTNTVRTNYLVAFYAQAVGSETVLVVSDLTSGAKYASFTLTGAGSAAIVGVNANVILSNANIANVGGGWYYGSVVYSTVTTASVPSFYVRKSTAPFLGDGISGVALWRQTVSAVTYETSPRPQDQVVTTASAYYGPKFDYGQGLRIWEGRTNLAINSSDMGTGYNTENGVFATDATVARDGVTPAKKYTATAGAGIHEAYNSGTISISAGANYSLSVDAVAGGSSCAALVIQNSVNKYVAAIYSLTGTSGSNAVLTKVGASATLVSAASTYVGNGRFRLSLVGAVPSSPVWTVFAPSDCSDQFTSNGDYSYTAAGTESVYVSLLQFEQASFSGPYIPTGSGAVAASADALTTSGALAANLAAGPWAYSWTNGQTGATSCVTGAAGAWTAPQNGWLRSFKVYRAGTPAGKVMC